MNEESAVEKIWARRADESFQNFYGRQIECEQKHLSECREPGCIKCKDAEVLIPYYHQQLQERTWQASAPGR